jgi:hypothetical protein
VALIRLLSAKVDDRLAALLEPQRGIACELKCKKGSNSLPNLIADKLAKCWKLETSFWH